MVSRIVSINSTGEKTVWENLSPGPVYVLSWPVDYEQAPAKSFHVGRCWNILHLPSSPALCVNSSVFLCSISINFPGHHLHETVRSQQCKHSKAQGLGTSRVAILLHHPKNIPARSNEVKLDRLRVGNPPKRGRMLNSEMTKRNLSHVLVTLHRLACAPGRHRQENWACHNFPASNHQHFNKNH